MDQLTRLLEAALFAAANPLTLGELRRLDPDASTDDLREALDRLRRALDEGGHGVELVELADGYQLLTRMDLAEPIARAQLVNRPRRLSAAALETLAIVAYRQPVSRGEIEEIRGVVADGVLRLLSDRGLIEVSGRSEGLGRPLLYTTTPKFLEMLGLKSISEMPRLDEFAVAMTPVGGRVEAEPEALDDA
ncbi:MAG TPA: SMC-Scp complex subunit ScpB [Gemmatimonadales bacterium]